MTREQRLEKFISSLEDISEECNIKIEIQGEGAFLYDNKKKEYIGELSSSFFGSGYEVIEND